MQQTAVLAERPAHVQADVVVDFDVYNPPGLADDIHAAWLTLRNGPRIVWTPRNGGHWIATRGNDIEAMQTDHQHFSHERITIPKNTFPSLPVESDPPRHTGLRSVISPLFTPETLISVEKLLRPMAGQLIDDLKPAGKCEFQGDVARRLPIVVFLHLVDFPLDDREQLVGYAEIRSRSPDAAARDAARDAIQDYIRDSVAKRKKNPGTDLLSRVLQSTVDGKPIPDEDMDHLIFNVMAAGLDTVASMAGFVMRFLAGSAEHRKQLAENRQIIGTAVHELIRRNGISNTARTIIRDLKYGDVEFKAGEQICLPNSLVGLDPDRFSDPLKVDFGRRDAGRHAAFGNGIHRCPGANLARLEIKIILEEWFARIPEFCIDTTQPVLVASGMVNSVRQLPLVWTAS